MDRGFKEEFEVSFLHDEMIYYEDGEYTGYHFAVQSSPGGLEFVFYRGAPKLDAFGHEMSDTAIYEEETYNSYQTRKRATIYRIVEKLAVGFIHRYKPKLLTFNTDGEPRRKTIYERFAKRLAKHGYRIYHTTESVWESPSYGLRGEETAKRVRINTSFYLMRE